MRISCFGGIVGAAWSPQGERLAAVGECRVERQSVGLRQLNPVGGGDENEPCRVCAAVALIRGNHSGPLSLLD